VKYRIYAAEQARLNHPATSVSRTIYQSDDRRQFAAICAALGAPWILEAMKAEKVSAIAVLGAMLTIPPDRSKFKEIGLAANSKLAKALIDAPILGLTFVAD